MKRSILWVVVIFLTLPSVLSAQAINERGFSFQGYARNSDGSAVSNQTISVKFSIYPAGNEGSPAFEETQTKDTDAFGIFTAEIGTVNSVIFKGLDFIQNDFFLKVEVSIGGSNLIEISNTRLNSVPYAQAAAVAAKADEATIAGNGVPSGTIMPFAGDRSKLPAGYVVCDGTSYDGNNATYAALFEAIGTNWGQDGGNFRVPDLRGYFLRGVDETANRDPNKNDRFALFAGNVGNNVGSFQNSDFASHLHSADGDLRTANDGKHQHNVPFWAGSSGGGKAASNGDPEVSVFRTANDDLSNHNHDVVGNTSATGGNETRAMNAYVLYIIKL